MNDGVFMILTAWKYLWIGLIFGVRINGEMELHTFGRFDVDWWLERASHVGLLLCIKGPKETLGVNGNT
jgi:hypothetical protein